MEPRKKSKKSRKSTNFPPEYLKSIEKIFRDAFKKQLGKRPLFIEGRILSDEVLLSVGIKPDPKALTQINFEASIDHKHTDVFEQVGVGVDGISSMLEHFFNTESKDDLPVIWTEFMVGKSKIYLQISARNTELENEADRLLGVDPNDALVKVHEPVDEDADEDSDDEPEDTKH